MINIDRPETSGRQTKTKAPIVSRRSILKTIISVPFGFLLGSGLILPRIVRAQEAPPPDTPTQPAGDQPSNQPVTIEDSDQTLSSDGETPQPAEAKRNGSCLQKAILEKLRIGAVIIQDQVSQHQENLFPIFPVINSGLLKLIFGQIIPKKIRLILWKYQGV